MARTPIDASVTKDVPHLVGYFSNSRAPKASAE
jgi:hypothetical protein